MRRKRCVQVNEEVLLITFPMQGIGSHKRQNGLIKKLHKSFEHTLVVSIKTRTLQRHKLKAA